MVSATTLSRVKAHIGDTSSANDALYASLIVSVSREVELCIGYDLLQAERTELYDLSQHDRFIFLNVVPVVSVAEVKIGPSYWGFSGISALTADQDYRLGPDGRLYLNGDWGYGFQKAQVKYTAGFGTTDTAVIAAAPAIAFATDIQVVEEFQRRRNPSTLTTTGPGGAAKTYVARHGLLPRVLELLSPYRRLLMVT